MDTPRPNTLTRTGGSLTITVRYDGVADTGPFGRRHRWAYRIEDAAQPDRKPAEGVDLYPTRRSPANAHEALSSLLEVLTAAGQALAHEMQDTGARPVGLVRFATWVPEAAHSNADKLEALALTLLRAERAAASVPSTSSANQVQWPPGRWYQIAFLQNGEGYEAVDLIEAQGPYTTIEDLRAGDDGAETRDTALFHDHTYTGLPTEPGGHAAESGPYVLVWHTGLGHVHLLRQFEPSHEPPAWWLDRTGLQHGQTARPKEGSPMSTKAHTDANALDAAARAVRALHALSSSSRQLDPSESYYTVRDLLACVRHLAQVAQHTAAVPAASGLAPGLKYLTDAVSARLDAVQTYLANAEIDLDVAASHAIHIFDVTPRRPITAEPGSLYPLPPDNAPSPPRPFPAPPGPALRDRPWQGPTL